jgi:hypothetical protein
MSATNLKNSQDLPDEPAHICTNQTQAEHLTSLWFMQLPLAAKYTRGLRSRERERERARCMPDGVVDCEGSRSLVGSQDAC